MSGTSMTGSWSGFKSSSTSRGSRWRWPTPPERAARLELQRTRSRPRARTPGVRGSGVPPHALALLVQLGASARSPRRRPVVLAPLEPHHARRRAALEVDPEWPLSRATGGHVQDALRTPQIRNRDAELRLTVPRDGQVRGRGRGVPELRGGLWSRSQARALRPVLDADHPPAPGNGSSERGQPHEDPAILDGGQVERGQPDEIAPDDPVTPSLQDADQLAPGNGARQLRLI